MNPLNALTTTILLLALTAVWGMLMLILFRAARNKDLKNRNKVKESMVPSVLQMLDEPAKFHGYRQSLDRERRGLLLEIFNEITSKVQGEYVVRVTEMMVELGVVEEGLAQLKSTFTMKRARACTTLGQCGQQRTIPALMERLDDRNGTVRLEAARALVRLGAPISAATILKKVSDGSGDISMAINDLFRSLGAKAKDDLLSILEGESTVSGKLLAMDALSHMGDLEVIPSLLKMLGHESLTVRSNALKSLSRLGDARILPYVILALGDRSWEVRAEAAICAGSLGSEDAAPALRKCLGDEFWWVRFRAAEALLRVGASGLQILREATHGAGPEGAIARGYLKEKGITI